MLTKEDILAEFNEEVAGTRKMLERVPFDKLDFKPSPKSMPLGQMAFMIGGMPGWFLGMIGSDVLDTADWVQPPKPKDVADLVRSFDEGVKKTQEALSKVDETSLAGNWELKMQGKTIMKLPRRTVLAQTVRHLVHHRAQLGVYFKIIGIPHPALYGPSGDER